MLRTSFGDADGASPNRSRESSRNLREWRWTALAAREYGLQSAPPFVALGLLKRWHNSDWRRHQAQPRRFVRAGAGARATRAAQPVGHKPQRPPSPASPGVPTLARVPYNTESEFRNPRRPGLALLRGRRADVRILVIKPEIDEERSGETRNPDINIPRGRARAEAPRRDRRFYEPERTSADLSALGTACRCGTGGGLTGVPTCGTSSPPELRPKGG
jgi:hypothetical protein